MTKPLVVNGWTLYAHPLFSEELDARIAAVEADKLKNSKDYLRGDNAKILAAIRKLIYEQIPANPGDRKFRLGGTLGAKYANWFRGKFFQQYRLFFRYDSKKKVIVYGWLNDEESLRAYGKKTDAYYVFAKMLGNGNPPDDFDALLNAATTMPGKK